MLTLNDEYIEDQADRSGLTSLFGSQGTVVPTSGYDTTEVLPAGMFAVTDQSPGLWEFSVSDHPGIGFHTLFPTVTSPLIPDICGTVYGPQLPLALLVVQALGVSVEVEVEAGVSVAADVGDGRTGLSLRVNCVSPGWIATKNYGALRRKDHAQHPAGRVGKPRDIAEIVAFLLDRGRSGFITGANFVVDGGMTRKMIYEE